MDGRITHLVDLPELRRIPHKSLGMLHNSIRTGDCVPHGFGADNRLVAIEENDRRRRKFAFLIGNRDGLAKFIQPGNAGVCRTKVDTDRMSMLHFDLSNFESPWSTPDRTADSERR